MFRISKVFFLTVILTISFSSKLLAECLSPDVCAAIETVKIVLVSDSFDAGQLKDYQENLSNFIEMKEEEYGALGIKNPDIDTLRDYISVIDSKLELLDCGDSGEIFSGFIKEVDGSTCSDANLEDQPVEVLAEDVENIEQFVVAEIAEQKMVESGISRMIELCDEGGARTKEEIKSCVSERGLSGMAEEELDDRLKRYNPSGENRDPDIAKRANKLMEDLRGGRDCAEADALVAGEHGGINISGWTTEDNPLAKLRESMSLCSPLKGMAILETIFTASPFQGWSPNEQDALREGMQSLWAEQHDRAHGMLTEAVAEMGPAAMGGRIYDCFTKFPPPQMSTRGFTLNNIQNGGDFINAKGDCKEFDEDDAYDARKDAIKFIADEMNDKNDAREGNHLFGKDGSDANFLAHMAKDNPAVLGQALALKLGEGSDYGPTVCEAMKGAQELERKEERNRKLRRAGLFALSGATMVLAFTPASPGAFALAGIGAGVGVLSVASVGYDLHNTSEEIRAAKFRLMGKEEDFSPEDWQRMQDLEKEFDALVVELALEVGLTAFDVVEFAKYFSKMDDYVEAMKKIKKGGKKIFNRLKDACS